jgi:hypothetical protein
VDCRERTSSRYRRRSRNHAPRAARRRAAANASYPTRRFEPRSTQECSRPIAAHRITGFCGRSARRGPPLAVAPSPGTRRRERMNRRPAVSRIFPRSSVASRLASTSARSVARAETSTCSEPGSARHERHPPPDQLVAVSDAVGTVFARPPVRACRRRPRIVRPASDERGVETTGCRASSIRPTAPRQLKPERRRRLRGRQIGQGGLGIGTRTGSLIPTGIPREVPSRTGPVHDPSPTDDAPAGRAAAQNL